MNDSSLPQTAAHSGAQGVIAVRPPSTFMGFPFAPEIEDLDIAILGVPWDGGTPVRVGSRHAPREIRTMSERIHALHPIYDLSPADLCRIGDAGDVRITPFDQRASLTAIENFYRRAATAGVLPVTAGGDHLITLPILRGIAQNRPLALVHFDAHCDTADSSHEGEKYTSATPFRRAVEEGLVDPKRIVQIGIRGTVRSNEKMRWAQDNGIRQITVDELYDTGLNAVIQETRAIIGSHPAYITVDIDGIDPAFAPGTGTPVIGGLTSYEAQRIIRGLTDATIVGGDVVEVSPPHDVGRMTSLLGATLMYEILCLVAQTHNRAGAGRMSTDNGPD